MRLLLPIILFNKKIKTPFGYKNINTISIPTKIELTDDQNYVKFVFRLLGFGIEFKWRLNDFTK